MASDDAGGSTRAKNENFLTSFKVRGGDDVKIEWNALRAVVVSNVNCIC